MDDLIHISDRITIGGQPSGDDIRRLRDEGFQSIMNLRTAGEPEDPFPSDEEENAARDAGLGYVHFPIDAETLTPERVDEFRREITDLTGPVYVHCHRGSRAGCLALMHVARKQGWTADEALERGAEAGFRLSDSSGLREFVRRYLDGPA